MTVQIVRSLCHQSGGNSNKTERGCYEALLRLINKAQHYIYIEQQYFITNYGGDTIWNIIGIILSDQIIKAYHEKRKFKVILVIPIFNEGENGSKVVKSLMYLTKKSIYKGKESIYQRLSRAGIQNIEEYFIVLSLYTYDHIISTNKIIASPIYIHSKFMIVDDTFVFIGSSNINDRSLMGDRDSEIGAIIVDSHKTTILMNSKPTEVTVSGHELRKKLWNEHLGQTIISDDLEDPIISLEQFILPIASHNTLLYEQNFLSFPSNRFRKFEDKLMHLYPLFHGNKHDLSLIKGHFIKFPLYFGELEKQTLSIGNIIIE